MNMTLSQSYHYWTSTIWTPLALMALVSSLNCFLHESKPGFGIAWVVISAVLLFFAYQSVQDQFAWDTEDDEEYHKE